MIELRHATDIDELMRWRLEVIANVFGRNADNRLAIANRQYYARHIPDGSHVAFIVSCDSVDVGCGALCITEELPSPDNPSGRCGYLMNIYVREPYRHKGIAEAIVHRLIDKASSLGCDKIYLEATDMARKLYGAIGFADMKNMMKYDRT